MSTLDEYRRKLVVRLEGCELTQAKMLLAEADLWLAVSRISEGDQDAFWRAVSRELDHFADEIALLRLKTLASLLGAVLNKPHRAVPFRPSVRSRRHRRRHPA